MESAWQGTNLARNPYANAPLGRPLFEGGWLAARDYYPRQSEERCKRLEEALRDLLEAIREEKVDGTCPSNACHWPAVQRQAMLAEEDLSEQPEKP
jgi:hypothetical protein